MFKSMDMVLLSYHARSKGWYYGRIYEDVCREYGWSFVAHLLKGDADRFTKHADSFLVDGDISSEEMLDLYEKWLVKNKKD
jgi:hypothetical protein